MSATKSRKTFNSQKILEDGKALQILSNRLYQNAVPEIIKKGAVIIQKGEKTEYAYYIVSGKVYVQMEFVDGYIYRFSSMKKGAVISDIEVLSGTYINAATVIAAQDTEALKIPVKLFAKELKINREFLYYVSTGISLKMYNSSYNRGNNFFKKGIYKVVLYLIQAYEADEEEQETVTIRKTRPEIASEVGISVKTLNRSVVQLHRDQKISVEKGKILISGKQFQALLDLAERENLY